MKAPTALCSSSSPLLLPVLSLLLLFSVALVRGEGGGEEEGQCVRDCLQYGASNLCACEEWLGQDEFLLSPAVLKRRGAFPFRYGKREAKRQMPFRYGKKRSSSSSSSSASASSPLSSSSSSSLLSLLSSSTPEEAMEKRQFRYGKRQFRYGKRAAEPGPAAALFGYYTPQRASAYNHLSSMAEEQ